MTSPTATASRTIHIASARAWYRLPHRMTRFTSTMAVEVNWNAKCRLATLRTRDPGRMVDQSTMPVATTPTAAMRAPSITQVAATGASRKCPILETTSRPRAVVYRVMGKWTVAGWVGWPIGFPWMISLSVQDMVPPVAVRRLRRQHTPGRRPQASSAKGPLARARYLGHADAKDERPARDRGRGRRDRHPPGAPPVASDEARLAARGLEEMGPAPRRGDGESPPRQSEGVRRGGPAPRLRCPGADRPQPHGFRRAVRLVAKSRGGERPVGQG